jgi:hypothetical protein
MSFFRISAESPLVGFISVATGSGRLLLILISRCRGHLPGLGQAPKAPIYSSKSVSDQDSAALKNWVIQRLAKQIRFVKNPSITLRRDSGLIAALCAAPARGTPRKWPENCLKIEGREVLLWNTAIEEPCFADSLRFWHAWRERLARPDQRRLYRKSLLWGQSRLLFPGPNGAPLSRAALHNALRRLNLAGERDSIGPITPEKIRAAFLWRDPL